MTPKLENWSRDYWMAHETTVDRYEGDLALMDADLYEDLVQAIGGPLIGYVGGIHYEFIPTFKVLSDRVAVPRQNHKGSYDNMTLLLSK
jgi:hypothetical protein